MELSPIVTVLVGLILAAWTFAAAMLIVNARGRVRQAHTARAAARRFARMIETSPAIPLLVRGDGALEGPARLAAWLGLDHLPRFLSELHGEEAGLSDEELEHLRQEVRRTLKTAAPFRMVVTPRGSHRRLAVIGQFADRLVAPEGAALVWWFDHTENDDELNRLRAETGTLRTDFTAILQLIEAAPVAMWFRGPDLALQMVNRAYVAAVGATDAATVLRDQVELVEAVDGRGPAEFAARARDRGEGVERMVQATIGGQRRTLRVRDLPVGGEGVAGFAMDIDEQETSSRAITALGEAQRALLERLSVGVARFDFHRRLEFANPPFRRLFALDETGTGGLDFHRFLERARVAGRVPESGDFPAWRRSLGEWFGRHEPIEEAWALGDGTHLRMVGAPMPDGGLVLLAEDRSEQLAVAARRDIQMRTHAATLDTIGEALVVFTPDGGVQSWNRRFPDMVGIAPESLAAPHRAEQLLTALAEQLDHSERAGAIGEAVRAATLERQASAGRLQLAGGRMLDFSAVPLPDGNGLLVLRDVSGVDAAEAARREFESALEASEAERAGLLAGIAARLRSGLLAIGGSAEALRDGAPGDHVGTILDIAGELEMRLERLADQASGAADRTPLATTEVELMPLLTEVVREREAAIEAKDITLNLSGAKRAGTLSLDRAQIEQALGSLLDDMLAAAPRGGRIDVNLARLRGEVRIEIVGDVVPVPEGWSGDGAEAVQLVPGDLKRVRRVVEAHGGRFQLRSGPRGTRIVTIILA